MQLKTISGSLLDKVNGNWTGSTSRASTEEENNHALFIGLSLFSALELRGRTNGLVSRGHRV